MTEIYERLQEARRAAGYTTASGASAAIGVALPTYMHHENGTRGLRRETLVRYARFYRVSPEWLLTGRGGMRGTKPRSEGIPIDGVVGAGFAVEMIHDPAGDAAPDQVSLPADGTLGALVVRGESQWPVFTEGEVILFDRRPVLPRELLGKMAIVQTADGRRLLKTLRRGEGDDLWTLESHNAAPERNVRLIGAWRYIGSLERD